MKFILQLLVSITCFSMFANAGTALLSTFIRKDFDAGCACTYFSEKSLNEILFASDPGSSGMIKVGDKFIGLTTVGSDQMHLKKAGAKYSFEYSGSGYLVKFDGKRTSNCPLEKPDCQEEKSSGVLIIKKGKTVEKRVVQGHCEECK